MHFIIYGLIDPRDNQLRYIGQSQYGLKRSKAHWKSKHQRQAKDHTHNWIRNVLSDNLEPEIEILEEWPGGSDPWSWLDDTEIFYIAYFKMIGAKLTNQTLGGGGARGMKFPNRKGPSLEVRRKISKTLTGRKLSKEQREAISRGQRENRVYPERYWWGHKISSALSGIKQPKQVIEKRAASNTGKKRTEEQRIRMTLAQQNRRRKERKPLI